MQSEVGRKEIPYFEYGVINKLLHGHIKELGNALQAVIVFGPLVTRGDTHDIDLLEIVNGQQEPSQYQAESSADLPMRGKLYLNFVSSADFQRSVGGSQRSDLRKLIERVLIGYEVVYENPTGFARDILETAADFLERGESGAGLSNPLSPPVVREPIA